MFKNTRFNATTTRPCIIYSKFHVTVWEGKVDIKPIINNFNNLGFRNKNIFLLWVLLYCEDVSEEIVGSYSKAKAVFFICFVIQLKFEVLALPVCVGGLSTRLFPCLRVIGGLILFEGSKQLLFIYNPQATEGL